MTALLLAAAVTLSGECGPLGLDCELAVARTCANRMADERWPDDLEDVLEGYYGRGTPTDTALMLAYVLVEWPEALADGRWYYCYSEQDRTRQGWPRGQQTVSAYGLTVHFSETVEVKRDAS